MTVYCALFTALIIIGGYISIPIPVGPVPIVLTDFFVMLTGLFLGWKHGLASVLLYLALGALGLPVFAEGTAGLAILVGPTGGYLLAYPFLVLTVGLIAGDKLPSIPRILLALIVGNVVLYAIGVPWLKVQMGIDWMVALAAGLTPFIPGLVIKVAVACAMARALLAGFRQSLANGPLQ